MRRRAELKELVVDRARSRPGSEVWRVLDEAVRDSESIIDGETKAVTCLGLVFVVMGVCLLGAAWTNGRSVLLAIGSLGYVAVGWWVLASAARRGPRG